jgi:SPP1 family predicted phage head-tail adaptor
MSKINVGQLTHKLTINYNAQPNRTDDNGNPFPDWQLLDTVFAKKTGMKGYQYFQAAAVQAEDDVLYTILYRGDIKAGMQIIDKLEILEIKVPPFDLEGDRHWVDIHARAVLNNGG